jgi:hypothetical protein
MLRQDRTLFHQIMPPVYAEMTRRSGHVVFHCRSGQIRSAVAYIMWYWFVSRKPAPHATADKGTIFRVVHSARTGSCQAAIAAVLIAYHHLTLAAGGDVHRQA